MRKIAKIVGADIEIFEQFLDTYLIGYVSHSFKPMTISTCIANKIYWWTGFGLIYQKEDPKARKKW